jgi:NADH dehydrogenase
MRAHRVLVVGGGYAGALVATRLARRGQSRVAVTLASAGPELVERVRLADAACNGRAVVHDLRRELGSGVRFVLGRMVGLDEARSSARLDSGKRQHDELFDTCVVATGSVRDDGDVPGAAAHALDIGTHAGALVVRQRLVALSPGARVVVCGGGLSAIEVTAELADAFPLLRIAVVTEGLLGPGLSAKGRAAVVRHLLERRVAIGEHARVTQVDEGGVSHEQGRLDADLVLWCAGMRASPLPATLGLAVDAGGRALVDASLRSTSHPNVMVVGDAAAIVQNPLRMGCVTALPMAIHAADDILARLEDGAVRPFRFRFYFQCISLGRRSGLIQFVGADDSPRPRVITGRAAAILKERLCRYAGRRPFRERLPAPPVAVGPLVATE